MRSYTALGLVHSVNSQVAKRIDVPLKKGAVSASAVRGQTVRFLAPRGAEINSWELSPSLLLAARAANLPTPDCRIQPKYLEIEELVVPPELPAGSYDFIFHWWYPGRSEQTTVATIAAT